MHRGYLKLYRKIEDWEWYDDLKLVGFFVHLILSANYKDSRYHGILIPRGSLVFGRKAAAKQFDVSERCIRTMLTKLKTTSEVTIKTTNKFSVVCIVNYEKYQSETASKTARSASHERPATDQQLTTSKEVKKVRTQEDKRSPAQSAASFEELVDNPKQVSLQEIEIKGQDETVKHKIFNQIVDLFTTRGWKTETEYLKRVFKAIVHEMDGYTPKEFFPYFRKVANNYVNKHAELFAADARIIRSQEPKLGITCAGVTV